MITLPYLYETTSNTLKAILQNLSICKKTSLTYVANAYDIELYKKTLPNF